MKKVIVLLALVAVGALVFAEDAPAPTYEFSANATGGWKYNLDAERSTFINDWDISLKYHLLNDIKKTKGADEGTYGFIEVTHLNLNLIEGTKGDLGDDTIAWGDGAGDGKGDNISVTAKIISGPFEVKLYGAPGNNYENAKYVPLFEKDAGYIEAFFGDDAITAATRDSSFKPQLDRAKGLSAKYTIGTFGFVEVGIANTDWVDHTVDPQYLFGANVQVKPVASDTLTVTIDGGFWTNTETSDMIMTAKAAVAAGDLAASVAFDGGKSPDASDVFQWDAASNVTYKLFEGKDSVQLDVYAANMTDDSDNMLTDLGLKFVDAEGFVPGLAFTAGFFFFDLLDNMEFDPKNISFAESISYKYALSDSTYVKPYQALRYDLNDVIYPGNMIWDPAKNAVWDDAVMYLNVGVEAQFFPNCVFTVDYYKGQKAKDHNQNLVKVADDSEFSIKAKVTL